MQEADYDKVNLQLQGRLCRAKQIKGRACMIKSYAKDTFVRDMFELIRAKPFNRESAEHIIEHIGDVNQAHIGRHDCPALFLGEAVEYCNLDAVRFFLEHGADPNIISDEQCAPCPIWLAILPCASDEKEEKLEILKLLLQYGGDPTLVIEGQRIVDELKDSLEDWIEESALEYIAEALKLTKEQIGE